MEQLLSHGLGILGSAAITALVAIGLAVTFRLMRVINLAHGSFLMVGAYVGVYAQNHWRANWIMAVLAAFVVTAGLGALIETVVVRRLYAMPELSILGTFGLAIVLQEGVSITAGNGYQGFANPVPGATEILGVLYPTYRLLLIVAAVVILALVIGAIQLTPLGVRLRAVAADRGLAETLGVRAGRLNLLVFSTSAALAGTAGVLIAPISTISPSMGEAYLLTAFVIVIVGGARISGVLAAALLVGAVQNLASLYWSPVIAQLAVVALALVALQWLRRSSAQAAW